MVQFRKEQITSLNGYWSKLIYTGTSGTSYTTIATSTLQTASITQTPGGRLDTVNPVRGILTGETTNNLVKIRNADDKKEIIDINGNTLYGRITYTDGVGYLIYYYYSDTTTGTETSSILPESSDIELLFPEVMKFEEVPINALLLTESGWEGGSVGFNLSFIYNPTNYSTPARDTLGAHIESIDSSLGSVLNHGSLLGLSNDDHTQYMLAATASVTDTAIAVWDGTTKRLIKDSVVSIDGSGNVTGVTTIDGYDLYEQFQLVQYYSDHGNLSGLSEDDHTQYMLSASSVVDNAIATWDETTGRLIQSSSVIIDDSGNVTGVTTIDGYDLYEEFDTLYDHAIRHISLGEDEIDGDRLDIDWVPTYYTRVIASGYSTTAVELTSHLKGLDNAVGIYSDHGHLSGLTDDDHSQYMLLASAAVVDNAIARWDGTTKRYIQSSSVSIDDSGNMTGVTTIDGYNLYEQFYLLNYYSDHGNLIGLSDDDHTQYMQTATASVTDNAIALWDGTSQRLIKDSTVSIDSSSNMTGVTTIDGYDLYEQFYLLTYYSDHGNLTGLSDDDHTQYMLAATAAVVDNTIATWDTTDQRLIQSTGVSIDDSDNITGVNTIAIGTSPATSGAIRLGNNEAIMANSGEASGNDCNLINLSSFDNLVIGDNGYVDSVYVYCNSDGSIKLIPNSVESLVATSSSIELNVDLDMSQNSILDCDYIEVGSTPATSGAIRLGNNEAITAAANEVVGDCNLINLSIYDIINIGDNVNVDKVYIWSNEQIKIIPAGVEAIVLNSSSIDFSVDLDMNSNYIWQAGGIGIGTSTSDYDVGFTFISGSSLSMYLDGSQAEVNTVLYGKLEYSRSYSSTSISTIPSNGLNSSCHNGQRVYYARYNATSSSVPCATFSNYC